MSHEARLAMLHTAAVRLNEQLAIEAQSQSSLKTMFWWLKK